MRHLNSINHLGRKSADRKAMMANLASSLILHKRITTTNAKARALRTYVEPLITKSKDDSTHSRRIVFSYLENKTAVSELFREVAPRIASRPGGYTRILKLGNRLGDSAEMCIIELVDFNENMLTGEGAKAKTTRRRRSPKKKTETVAATEAPAAKAPAAKAPAAKAPAAKAPAAKESAAPETAPEDNAPEADTKE
jgi:large subunit ribosomal protein L17